MKADDPKMLEILGFINTQLEQFGTVEFVTVIVAGNGRTTQFMHGQLDRAGIVGLLGQLTLAQQRLATIYAAHEHAQQHAMDNPQGSA